MCLIIGMVIYSTDLSTVKYTAALDVGGGNADHMRRCCHNSEVVKTHKPLRVESHKSWLVQHSVYLPLSEIYHMMSVVGREHTVSCAVWWCWLLGCYSRCTEPNIWPEYSLSFPYLNTMSVQYIVFSFKLFLLNIICWRTVSKTEIFQGCPGSTVPIIIFFGSFSFCYQAREADGNFPKSVVSRAGSF